MTAILCNSLREKIRKKVLYVVAGFTVLLIILVSSGSSKLLINGVAITSFEAMAPVLITLINVIGGVMAVVLSVNTIPNEYERKTSHLILIRGISQKNYHLALAVSNIIVSIASIGIMYLGVIIYSLLKQKINYVIQLFPAFLILCMCIAIVSLFTSAISICVPMMFAIVLSIGFYLLGVFHGFIRVFSFLLGGFFGAFVKYLMYLIPDLSGIQKQSTAVLLNRSLDIHCLLGGLLAIYILISLLLILPKKEI